MLVPVSQFIYLCNANKINQKWSFVRDNEVFDSVSLLSIIMMNIFIVRLNYVYHCLDRVHLESLGQVKKKRRFSSPSASFLSFMSNVF